MKNKTGKFCIFCNEIVTDLSYHIEAKHSTLAKNGVWECADCERKYSTIEKFVNHVRRHKYFGECSICKKSFQHIGIHYEVKIWVLFKRNFKIKKEHGIFNFKESSSQRHDYQKANERRKQMKKPKPEKIFILKVSRTNETWYV